jgi:hypothetical protein
MPKYPEFKSKPIIGLQEEDWDKLTVGILNRVDANQSKTNFLALKPELVAELAKPFITAQQMMEFKGENQKQIRAAGRLINKKKMSRPEWFQAIDDWTSLRAKGVVNTDWEARNAKIDRKANEEKRKAKINYASFQDKRVASMDWKKKVANTDYKAIGKKLEKPISQFDLQGNFIRDWDSASQVEREKGFKSQDINACCNGKQKTSRNFIWKFKLEQN